MAIDPFTGKTIDRRELWQKPYQLIGIVLILFLWAGGPEYLRRLHVRQQGAPATATITEKGWLHRGSGSIYYTYTGSLGVQGHGSVTLGTRGYQSLNVGDKIAIHYIPGRELDGRSSSSADDDYGRFLWNLCDGLALLVGVVGYSMIRGL